MRSKTRIERLEDEASRVGLVLDTYSPGDGVTRYRFGLASEQPNGRVDYFSMRARFTALGRKEAMTYLIGFEDAMHVYRRDTE